MPLLRVLAGCVALCMFAAFQLQAQKATCTNWKTFVLNPANPRNPEEESTGVNDNETVVGSALSSVKSGYPKAFVHYASGKITYWQPAGSSNSGFTDRNNLGNTVGYFVDSSSIEHAVYLHGSTVTKIAHPNAARHTTTLVSINNLNTLLGEYSDVNFHEHMFKRRNDGTFMAVPSFPGSKRSDPGGFNDNGVVVGSFTLPNDPSEFEHGFIYRNGAFAKLNYEGKAGETMLVGISNHGLIVGNWWGAAFLYTNGTFKDIVGPHGEQITVRGISSRGIITGNMATSTGPHGFTVTCQ